jgi:hypothetical protein
MFFGAFFITSTSCFGTYIFLVNYDGLDISSPIPTTVVMGFIAVTLSYTFLSIFSFSSDAILQAYHTDMAVTKGKGNQRPKIIENFKDKFKHGPLCCCCC